MDLFMNYDEILCRRIQEVKPSGIRRFFDILEEMKDAISLGVGEPDFVTPWHIRDAGIYSLEKGFTKYTSNAGMAELRREIAAYLNAASACNTTSPIRLWSQWAAARPSTWPCGASSTPAMR